jgi:putative transposase
MKVDLTPFLLRNEGWRVNHRRMERIWRQEGLKVPQRQPRRGRLWLTDGSCLMLRPMRKDHVWSYDLVVSRTTNGRPIRAPVIIDEYTRECLSLYVFRRISSLDVLEQPYELFISRGLPEYIRSDNGPKFMAQAVRSWLVDLNVRTLYIEPGIPWENGHVESFIGKLRDELLNGEILDTLLKARAVMGEWRKEYNHHRPHSSLGYRPPALEAYAIEKFNLGVVH